MIAKSTPYLTSPSSASANENNYWKGSEVGLQAICKSLLKNRRLLIASNRGPVTYNLNEDGQVVTGRGSGGVVTALSTLSRYTPITWIAAALNETDREMSRQNYLEVERNLRLGLVNIPAPQFESYLNVISNPLLWFLQHSQLDCWQERAKLNSLEMGRAWQTSYVEANKAFALRLLKEIRSGGNAPFVLFHDYQLYLAPGMVRKYCPEISLTHFTHIPWPKPTVWQALPRQMTQHICRSLLACDIASFQTAQDAANFIATCEEFLPDIQVSQTPTGNFKLNSRFNFGRATYVNSYPISIDPQAVRSVYLTEAAQLWRQKLAQQVSSDCKLIVRIDRLDPAKNILAGFEVYEELLATQPQWREKVSFLALLVPTRESLAEYNEYKSQVFAAIDRINARFQTANWQPIYKTYNNDYARALAALSLADVVMINSVADGMNLIAKETPIVSEQAAVLLLSRQAGAWQELQDYALGLEPNDKVETLQVLSQALTMGEAERSKRAQGLAQIVENNNLSAWLAAQLTDLAEVEQARTIFSTANNLVYSS